MNKSLQAQFKAFDHRTGFKGYLTMPDSSFFSNSGVSTSSAEALQSSLNTADTKANSAASSALAAAASASIATLAATSSASTQSFTGNGSTTSFSLNTDPGASGTGCQVYIDGVYQERSGYAINGSALVFTEAPPNNASIEVLKFTVRELGSTGAGSVAFTQSGTGAVQRSVDTKLRETVSVKDFGAVGNGTTDDTEAIQAAINVAIANGGGQVIFPFGTYIVVQLNVSAGIELVGVGFPTIKVKPNASQVDFSRMFTTQNNKYSGATDSKPLRFSGIEFDGNYTTQGAYTSFQLEHNAMIFLMGDNSTAGKLTAIVDSCRFKNGVADAVSAFVNTDVTVTNCTFENVFRGGVVITGGHTNVRVDNCSMVGDVHPTGIDQEVDGVGFGSSLATNLNVSNVLVQGDFDISVNVGGVATIDNVICEQSPFNIACRGKLRVSNSFFKIGVKSSSANRLVDYNDVGFTNCSFEAYEPSDSGDQEFACIHLFPRTFTNQRIVFNACNFGTSSSIESSDTVYGIYVNPTKAADNNVMAFNFCNFTASLDFGLYMKQGGTYRLSDTTFSCVTPVRLSSAGADFWVDYIETDSVYNSTVTTPMHIHVGNANNTIDFRNTVIDEAINVITFSGSGAIGTNVYAGSRTIRGASPPSTEPGLLGDIYRLKVPVAGSIYQWVCTATSRTSATWKAIITPAS